MVHIHCSPDANNPRRIAVLRTKEGPIVGHIIEAPGGWVIEGKSPQHVYLAEQEAKEAVYMWGRAYRACFNQIPKGPDTFELLVTPGSEGGWFAIARNLTNKSEAIFRKFELSVIEAKWSAVKAATFGTGFDPDTLKRFVEEDWPVVDFPSDFKH